MKDELKLFIKNSVILLQVQEMRSKVEEKAHHHFY